MIRIVALIALLHGPPLGNWFGTDKLKHFLMSAMVQSVTFSAARAVGAGKPASQIAAGSSVVAVGVWKEIQDRRAKKPFSVEDLLWDAIGGFAAASLLNGTR